MCLKRKKDIFVELLDVNLLDKEIINLVPGKSIFLDFRLIATVKSKTAFY